MTIKYQVESSNLSTHTIKYMFTFSGTVHPHLVDRIYKKFKFETYDKTDIKKILSELSEIPITNDGLEYLATRSNQFRQIVKLINKVENLNLLNNHPYVQFEHLPLFLYREIFLQNSGKQTLLSN